MEKTTNKISETYRQLFELFEFLENSHFEENRDFGENLTGCFQWFLSPPAIGFLDKRPPPFWDKLKINPRLKYRLEPWDGYKSDGASINLIL